MLPLAATPEGVSDEAWYAAGAAVRAYCGWHIAPSVDEVLTLDGPGGMLLRLPSAHVTAVTSVSNDGTQVVDPEWSQNGYIRGCWTERLRGVEVELTHGFEDCPLEVLSVLREIASASGRGGLRSVQTDSSSVTYETAMSDRQRFILDAYRLGPRP